MGEWQGGIRLPPAARQALAKRLRAEVTSPLPLQEQHTLPIDRHIWSLYASKCSDRAQRLRDRTESGPESPEFASLQRWVNGLVEGRRAVLSLLLALAPFEPFDDAAARAMLGALDWRLLHAASALDSGSHTHDDAEHPVATQWLETDAGCSADDVLPRAFGLPPEKVLDDAGEFSASRVFSEFYLDHGPLRRRLDPHLASLALPRTNDDLVAASAVGWLLSAEDHVAAYCSADALLAAFGRWPADARHVQAALDFLVTAEPAARQGRGRLNRLAAAGAAQGEPEETRMLALAELYKALVEGPFRRFGWVMHTLRSGTWGDVPMLASLRNALIADGGWLAGLAGQAVLTEVRNGMAHETLYWDGAARAFVTQGQQVPANRVAHAAILLDAFARGCDTATAVYAAWAGESAVGALRPDEGGRLAPWRRAEAFFGTNGLVLQHADFNAATASVTCEALAEKDINPCFQALVACHRLLPHVTRFDVRFASAPDLAISVTAPALERTTRVWDLARASFDVMPLAAFLPANMEARQASQPLEAAVRAVAWIAIDDVLDALDGSPEQWGRAEVEVFRRRVEVTGLAVAECLDMLQRRDQNELLGVRARLNALEKWLDSADGPLGQEAVSDLKPSRRLRQWYDRWGPVDRLPGIPRTPTPAFVAYKADRLRDSDWISPWQVL